MVKNHNCKYKNKHCVINGLFVFFSILFFTAGSAQATGPLERVLAQIKSLENQLAAIKAQDNKKSEQQLVSVIAELDAAWRDCERIAQKLAALTAEREMPQAELVELRKEKEEWITKCIGLNQQLEDLEKKRVQYQVAATKERKASLQQLKESEKTYLDIIRAEEDKIRYTMTESCKSLQQERETAKKRLARVVAQPGKVNEEAQSLTETIDALCDVSCMLLCKNSCVDEATRCYLAATVAVAIVGATRGKFFGKVGFY